MKIQLDTVAKTIKVDGDVKFAELIEALEKLLPQGEWKEFTLENDGIVAWRDAIIIKERERGWWPTPIWLKTNDTVTTPYKNNEIWCKSDSKLQLGTFNVEC